MFIDEINSLSINFLNFFKSNCIKFTKQEIEDADGRKKKTKISEKGSILYVVYNKIDKVLYVGETGVSIKSRFISDGKGSHKEKNSNWYNDIEYITMLNLDNDEIKIRKLLEQSLSISLQPKYYNGLIS